MHPRTRAGVEASGEVRRVLCKEAKGPRRKRKPKAAATINERCRDAKAASLAIFDRFAVGHRGPHVRGSKRKGTKLKLRHVLWYLRTVEHRLSSSRSYRLWLAVRELIRAMGKEAWLRHGELKGPWTSPSR